MKALKVIFLFISLLVMVGRLEAKELALNEVLTSVDKNFPLVMSAQIELKKAEADFFSSQGGFDPVLKSTFSSGLEGYYKNTYTDISVEQPTTLWGAKVFAGWRSGQGNFPVYNTNLATFTGGEFRGGVEVPLLRGGSTDDRRAKLKSAEYGVGIAQQSAQLQRLDVFKQAAFKYWEWLSAGKKLKVSKELLEISKVRDKALIDRVKHGDSAQIDQIDNRRAVVQREAAVISAERALQKASLELSLYFRDSFGEPLVVQNELLPREFPEPNLKLIPQDQEATVLVSKDHPEMVRFQLQNHQLEVDYFLAKNQILPRLDFKFGYYSDLGSNPGNNYLPPSSYPSELKGALILEFPILFRGSRGKFESASLSLDKLKMSQKLAQDRIQIQVKDSVQSMKAAFKRVGLARNEIELTRRLEEAERIRFQHGDSNLLIINIREQTTRDAFSKEFDALVDFYKSHAEYIAARGQNQLTVP